MERFKFENREKIGFDPKDVGTLVEYIPKHNSNYFVQKTRQKGQIYTIQSEWLATLKIKKFEYSWLH